MWQRYWEKGNGEWLEASSKWQVASGEWLVGLGKWVMASGVPIAIGRQVGLGELGRELF